MEKERGSRREDLPGKGEFANRAGDLERAGDEGSPFLNAPRTPLLHREKREGLGTNVKEKPAGLAPDFQRARSF